LLKSSIAIGAIVLNRSAHFLVDARLTRLLGETYRSSESAIKELVDNAWDADATEVRVTLPAPLSGAPLIVQDNGTGMTPRELRGEYLKIASDKRARTGERTQKFKRKIKGRKGIGKFAGLTLAAQMSVSSVARETRCTLVINKHQLIESGGDLEKIPLDFEESQEIGSTSGTTISLSELDDRLNYPTSERLREVLVFEYGREDLFKIYVDGTALSVDDVPGKTQKSESELPVAGRVSLNFTISEGKKAPRAPGIVVKVDGKAVGKPQMFGLDDDEEVPLSLLKKVVGEVELTGLTDLVTADWSAIVENSKAFEEVTHHVRIKVKEELKSEYAKEMSLQKARLQKKINSRIEKLPEHRRSYAHEAINRILKRFYGESDERIGVIAEVALDAMEFDVYWAVLDRINAASQGAVSAFAASLEQFGLLEISSMGIQAQSRMEFLGKLEELASNQATLEADIHKALESNLWVLGRSYALLSSNETLRSLVARLFTTGLSEDRASKRPDLLLGETVSGDYALIEFKRPAHQITRDDLNQAEKYRDDLLQKVPGKRIELILMGGGVSSSLSTSNLTPNTRISSFIGTISSARAEVEWIIKSLSRPQ
jgi:hypothetical protein